MRRGFNSVSSVAGGRGGGGGGGGLLVRSLSELGGVVRVDPIKPTLKAPGTMRLTLKHGKLLSSFAFNFNLHRYSSVAHMRPSRVGSGRLCSPRHRLQNKSRNQGLKCG
jgi:hypothetical protein